MQVIKLIIDDYKCFVDFKIDFDIIDGGSSTVLIGENGTGKSTFIEALLKILMSFDSLTLEKRLGFNYELEYLYAGQRVVILGGENGVHITVNKNNVYMGSSRAALRKVIKDGYSIFPERVNILYSGYNDNFRNELNTINGNYKKRCNKVLRDYLQFIDGETVDYKNENFPRKKYICNMFDHDDLFLIAVLCGQDSFEKTYLVDKCNFGKVDTVDIKIDVAILKNYISSKAAVDLHREGDHSGRESKYLDEFYKIVEYLNESFVNVFKDGLLYSEDEEMLFSLKNIEQLNLDCVDIYNFFEKLRLLFKIRINITLLIWSSYVLFHDLSEGQHQMLKILAATGLCKGEDCLVLMDEPDSHMNPKWKYELKTTIDESLSSATNTQAIIATHDPLIINGVDPKYIRIFSYDHEVLRRNNIYKTITHKPSIDTAGMGIDGLLQSEYYGLKTSYDKETSDKYQRRKELYIKLINNEIIDAEKIELRSVAMEIGGLPVSNNTIDFIYDDFIKEFRNSEYYLAEYLSIDEIKDRQKTIAKIISELFEAKS